MPKCMVKACPHSTGQKTAYPDISLHAFPRKIPQMQAWLRLAGMDEEMVKDFTEMIIEDRRADKFRMCSAHFTEDCYIMKGVRRVLKEESLPSIFPKEVPIFDVRLDPWVRRNNRRARNEDLLDPYGEPYRRHRKCYCDCHRQRYLVDTATQTDPVFILSMVQQIPYTKLASRKRVTLEHAYTRIKEMDSPQSVPDEGKIPEDIQQILSSETIQAGIPNPSGVRNVGTSSGLYTEDEDFLDIHVKDEPLSDDEHPLGVSTDPSTYMKAEVCEEELVPIDMDYTAVVVNDYPMSCEDFTRPPCADISMQTYQIKEEPLTEDENIPHSDVFRSTSHTLSKKKRLSCEGASELPKASTLAQHTLKEQVLIGDSQLVSILADSLPHFERSQSSSSSQEVTPEVTMVPKAPRRTPPFKCQYCGKECKSLNYLSRHEEIHQKKTHKCLVCGKCFTSSIGLTVHQKTHKAQRVVEYPKPKQAFLIDSNMNLHQQIRTAQLSIICFECGKVFQVQKSLKEHQSVLEKRIIYRCFECQSHTKGTTDGNKSPLLRPAEDILLPQNG
ncbi:uncharacterized protein [Pyxicephalus adspersus]|uniref:uncharacterized protein isoform X2 n=1 Tax=Pyxicephalus adspersus TaxID=30357 RepID=UPI003B5CCFDC